MAILSRSLTHNALFPLIALFLILFSNPILILSSETLDTTPTANPNFFDSQISLHGDAAFIDGGSTIRLTAPSISSSGMVVYQKPVKFLEPNPRNGVSFSAHIDFSISPENSDGVMFIIAPNDSVLKFSGGGKFGLKPASRFFGVQFGPSQIGIYLSNFVWSITNDSGIDLSLNSGRKLQSWIDYDASSKRIEVRMSEFGTARPYNSFLSCGLDFGKIFKDEEVYLGVGASSKDSMQSSMLYSCRFVVRDVRSSLHSQPLDPSLIRASEKSVNSDEAEEKKSGFFPLSVLAGLIFTTGCGALVAFVVLFLWVVFVDRHRMAAEPEFKYENIKVIVENDIDDVKTRE